MLIAPLMPGINDSPEQVREVVRLATEAGADYITGIGLHLRPGVREVFLDWLGQDRPELVPRYEQLYGGRAYLPPEERRRLAALLRGPSPAPRSGTGATRRSGGVGGGARDSPPLRPAQPSGVPAGPIQTTLF